MATFVGLDLSSTRARILQAEGSAKKLKVAKFKIVELEPPGEGPAAFFVEKELADKIGTAFSEAKIAREPITMSWDSALTVFRELDLPFTGDEQIRKVIKYEAEQHLLNCDIDDVVVDFYKLVETRDKSHVMVMAVRKDQLMNRFEVLTRAGVDPLQVDLDVMATFNALHALGYTTEHEAFCVLDCGRRTTNVLLIVKGRLVSARAIRTGSDMVTARLATDLDAPPEAVADRAKSLLANPDPAERDLMVRARPPAKRDTDKDPAELERDLALARAGDFYGKLTREVRRTLATSRVDVPVEAVFVTGKGSLMPGFVDSIRQSFGSDTEVKPLDVLTRVEHPFQGDEAREIEAELITPLGLAFKGAGHDESGVDFRQEECGYTRKFDQVKEPLIYFSFCVLLFVLILNLLDLKGLSVKEPFLIKETDADMARIHDTAKELFQLATGNPVPENRDDASLLSMRWMKSQMDLEIANLEAQLGRGGAIPKMTSALSIWREVFDALAPHMDGIGKLVLESMRIQVRMKRPQVDLTGYVADAAAFEAVRAALSSIPNVEIEVGQYEPAGDGIKFSNLKIKYPEQAEYR